MNRSATFCLLVLGLLAGCQSQAGLQAADEPSGESQAAAQKVFAEWYAALAEAKSLGVTIESKVEVSQNGEVVQSDDTSYRLSVERPNRLSLVTTKGLNLTVIADGKQLIEYVEPLHKYQVAESSPATFADLMKSRVLRFVSFRMGLGILGDALKSDSFDAFWATYKSPSYVGVEEKLGVKAHHIRLTREEMPFDVWIAADAPRLTAVEPDVAAGLAQAGQALDAGIKYVIATTYKDWSYDAALPADAFAFTAPSDAEQVDDIFAPPPHVMLGKQMPQFETTDLDGHPLKSADLAGKVVMLDFWATWCGPCVAALPKVNEVATKYKDKGVVFYAVNQDEPASVIKEFLAAQEMKLPVALDAGGAIGGQFGVEGIPQTVIIDKNGKIQVVHVGAGPDIDQELKKDLDAVLAGRDLVGEKGKAKSK